MRRPLLDLFVSLFLCLPKSSYDGCDGIPLRHRLPHVRDDALIRERCQKAASLPKFLKMRQTRMGEGLA